MVAAFDVSKVNESDDTILNRDKPRVSSNCFLAGGDILSATFLATSVDKLFTPFHASDAIPENILFFQDVVAHYPLAYPLINVDWSDVSPSRDASMDCNTHSDDEFSVIETIQNKKEDVDTIAVIFSESEHRAVEAEELMKMGLWLDSFQRLSPYIHLLGSLGDAFVLTGVEMKTPLLSCRSASECGRLNLTDPILKVFTIALAMYLHAIMFLEDMSRKLQDILRSVVISLERVKLFGSIQKAVEDVSKVLMKRVSFYHGSSGGVKNFESDSCLTGRIRCYDLVPPEPILYQLASFLKKESDDLLQPKAAEMRDVCAQIVDIINLTVHDALSKKILNDLMKPAPTIATTATSCMSMNP